MVALSLGQKKASQILRLPKPTKKEPFSTRWLVTITVTLVRLAALRVLKKDFQGSNKVLLKLTKTLMKYATRGLNLTIQSDWVLL